MGKKLVEQKGVKGNPEKTIRRRAQNKTLREVKKAIKEAQVPSGARDKRQQIGDIKTGGDPLSGLF
jgi:hypothetical protein